MEKEPLTSEQFDDIEEEIQKNNENKRLRDELNRNNLIKLPPKLNLKELYANLRDPAFEALFGIKKDLFSKFSEKFKLEESYPTINKKKVSNVIRKDKDALQEHLTAFFAFNLIINAESHHVDKLINFFIGDINSTIIQNRIERTNDLLRAWIKEINGDIGLKNLKKALSNISLIKEPKGAFSKRLESCFPKKNVVDSLKSNSNTTSSKSVNNTESLERMLESFVNKFPQNIRNQIIDVLHLKGIIDKSDEVITSSIKKPKIFNPGKKKVYISYCQNLDLFYLSKSSADKTIFIEGNAHHLFLAEQEKKQRLSLQFLGDTKINSNLAIATIGFVISAEPLAFVNNKYKAYKRKYISVNITVPNENKKIKSDKSYYDRKDFEEKSLVKVINQLRGIHQNRYENESLEKQKTNPKADHHSEVVLYAYLLEDSTIDYLAEQLIKAIRSESGSEITKGYRLYAVILDIRSTRNLCQNCAPLSYGITHSNPKNNDFLSKLKNKLINKYDFSPGNNNTEVRMIIRYSYETYDNENKPAEDYTITLDSLEDAKIKDVKQLYKDDKPILHAKQPQSETKAPLTIFFSGSQIARAKERAFEEKPDVENTKITSPCTKK